MYLDLLKLNTFTLFLIRGVLRPFSLLIKLLCYPCKPFFYVESLCDIYVGVCAWHSLCVGLRHTCLGRLRFWIQVRNRKCYSCTVVDVCVRIYYMFSRDILLECGVLVSHLNSLVLLLTQYLSIFKLIIYSDLRVTVV